MLEENLRELQVSSADALASEQRRSKDLIARLEREKVKLNECIKHLRVDYLTMVTKYRISRRSSRRTSPSERNTSRRRMLCCRRRPSDSELR